MYKSPVNKGFFVFLFYFVVIPALGLFAQNSSPLVEIKPEVFPKIILEVNKEDADVLLNWSNDQDSLVLYYDIERSTDAENFETVKHVESIHSSCLRTYGQADRFPENGLVYYRIRAAYRAEFHYSGIVAIENNYVPAFMLSNDAKTPLALKFVTDKSDEAALVVLYDVYGKELYSKITISGDDRHETIFSEQERKGIPPGIYFITATNERGYFKKKLIVS